MSIALDLQPGLNIRLAVAVRACVVVVVEYDPRPLQLRSKVLHVGYLGNSERILPHGSPLKLRATGRLMELPEALRKKC